MNNEKITRHGAEIHAAWTKAGGTKDGWLSVVVPILQKAGAGPLYSMQQQTLDDILAQAK